MVVVHLWSSIVVVPLVVLCCRSSARFDRGRGMVMVVLFALLLLLLLVLLPPLLNLPWPRTLSLFSLVVLFTDNSYFASIVAVVALLSLFILLQLLTSVLLFTVLLSLLLLLLWSYEPIQLFARAVVSEGSGFDKTSKMGCTGTPLLPTSLRSFTDKLRVK